VLTVGVDLVEIERIADVIRRHGDRFMERVFTPAECTECAGRVEALAARWAAKEAAVKALGTGIGDIKWREVEVWSDQRGKPHIRLHGAAHQRAAALGIVELAVSLAHADEHAIAFVVGSALPEDSAVRR
jgi:holo-[acyl-carrier protein] synthase